MYSRHHRRFSILLVLFHRKCRATFEHEIYCVASRGSPRGESIQQQQQQGKKNCGSVYSIYLRARRCYDTPDCAKGPPKNSARLFFYSVIQSVTAEDGGEPFFFFFYFPPVAITWSKKVPLYSRKRNRSERRGISNSMHVPDQIKRGSTFEFHAKLAKQRQNQSPGYLSLVS